MTYTEKPTDPSKKLGWRGDMQADYLYPNGVAGDRFFKHLMKSDTFMACKCPECGMNYFPPRLYCEECFVEIPAENWKEVPASGTVRLYTVAKMNAEGEPMAPKIIALIDIDETDGATLGVIKTNEFEKDLTGTKVKAVLRPKDKREGTLKDILHFEIA